MSLGTNFSQIATIDSAGKLAAISARYNQRVQLVNARIHQLITSEFSREIERCIRSPGTNEARYANLHNEIIEQSFEDAGIEIAVMEEQYDRLVRLGVDPDDLLEVHHPIDQWVKNSGEQSEYGSEQGDSIAPVILKHLSAGIGVVAISAFTVLAPVTQVSSAQAQETKQASSSTPGAPKQPAMPVNEKAATSRRKRDY